MDKENCKKKKIWLKTLLILLIVILIAAASVVAWQWKNIRSVYLGLSSTTEEIAQMRADNQKSMVEEVGSFMDGKVRELTPEEEEQIKSGESSAEEIYEKIFREKYEQEKKKNTETSQKEPNANKQNETNDKKEATASENSQKKTKDEIVSKYIAELYSLQSKYTATAEATVAQGLAHYKNLRKTTDAATARANTIQHFTPIVRGVEASCDGEVERVISELVNELKAIGENTDIAGTIRSAYANEKQYKLSYYSSKYLR